MKILTGLGAAACAAMCAVGLTLPAVAQYSSLDDYTQQGEPKFRKVPRGAIPGQYLVTVHVQTRQHAYSVAPIAQDLAQRYKGSVLVVYAAYCRCFGVSMAEAEALKMSEDPAVEVVDETNVNMDPHRIRDN